VLTGTRAPSPLAPPLTDTPSPRVAHALQGRFGPSLRLPGPSLKPETFIDDIKETLLFNVVNPLTFNDDTNVVLFDKVVNPLTFHDDNNVVLLFNVVKPLTPKQLVLKNEYLQ
jgi:hypothetical protein